MYYRLVSNYLAVIRCVSAIAEKAIVAQKRLSAYYLTVCYRWSQQPFWLLKCWQIKPRDHLKL